MNDIIRFSTMTEAEGSIREVLDAGEGGSESFDVRAIADEVFDYKVDEDADGDELLNTAGFEQIVDNEEFWEIVAKHDISA